VLDPWMLARPQYELPPMKDGLSLYSQHYTFFGR
jgi:hypothetical protein